MSISHNMAIKAGFGFTAATIISKGAAFLTLPLFSRLLEPTDFGIYNVFLAYDAILYCIIGFALHSSIKKANWEFPGRIDAYISSITLIYIGSFVVFLLLSFLLAGQIESVTGFGTDVIIALVVYSFGSSLVTLYSERASLFYEVKEYFLISLFSTIGNIGLSLVLILTLFSNDRYLGRILGGSIAFGVLAVFIVISFWKREKPAFHKEWWSFGLKYSLPIVPHGISQVLLGQFDRLMIVSMVSSAAAGVYSLAANIQTAIAALGSSVASVWSTWFFETMEGENSDCSLSKKASGDNWLESVSQLIQSKAYQITLIFTSCIMLLMMFAPEIIWILGGDGYETGAYCAYGLLLSSYCVLIYNLVVVGEYYHKKTSYILLATIVAAGIDIGLNLIVIPHYGAIAAAYTTAFSYVCYAGFHWAVSTKLLSFSILPVKQTLLCFALVVLCMCLNIWSNAILILRLSINVPLIGVVLFLGYWKIKRQKKCQ